MSVGFILKSVEKFCEVIEKIFKMLLLMNLMVIWFDFEEGKDLYKVEFVKLNLKFLLVVIVN